MRETKVHAEEAGLLVAAELWEAEARGNVWVIHLLPAVATGNLYPQSPGRTGV